MVAGLSLLPPHAEVNESAAIATSAVTSERNRTDRDTIPPILWHPDSRRLSTPDSSTQSIAPRRGLLGRAPPSWWSYFLTGAPFGAVLVVFCLVAFALFLGLLSPMAAYSCNWLRKMAEYYSDPGRESSIQLVRKGGAASPQA